jgi:hypothetical protein
MSKRSVPYGVFAFVVLASAGAAFAGEGVVALQTADPSCPSDTAHRYRDCGNGTVTDNQTGLVWLANAECFGGLDWDEAMEVVAGLGDLQCSPKPGDCDCGLSDGSSPGEWRLASSDEWMAMVEAAEKLGCSPTITNDAGNDCWDQQCVDAGACSLYRVQSAPYWTSTAAADSPFAFAKHLATFRSLPPDLRNAPALPRPRESHYFMWPVRSGQ